MQWPNLDPLTASALQNGVFFFFACLYVAIGARRAQGTANFPGPRPPAGWFKIWLVVIWLVGLMAPLGALIYDGVMRGVTAATIGLGFYLLMVFAQIATEIFVWKRWKSPIWVIVPCLYLTWRLWQCVWGLMLLEGVDAPVSVATFLALMALWIINIGVHFTNIPMTLRWDYHPKSATFPALHNPNALAKGAHDAHDPQAGAKSQ
jgi:hypothetical protein